jgi:hypothetical protein
MNRDTPNSVRLLVWLAHNMQMAVDIVVCSPRPPWMRDQGEIRYSDLAPELRFYNNTPVAVRTGLLPLHLVVKGTEDALRQAAGVGIQGAEVLAWMFNGIFFFTEGQLGHPVGRVTRDSSAQRSLEKRILASTFVQKVTTFKVDQTRSLDDEDNDF